MLLHLRSDLKENRDYMVLNMNAHATLTRTFQYQIQPILQTRTIEKFDQKVKVRF